MKRINPVIAAGAVILIALVVFVVIRSTRKPAPAAADATSTQAAVGVPSAAPTTPTDSMAQTSPAPGALPPMASPRGMAAPPVATSPALQEREPTKEEVAHIPRIAPEELLEAYNAKSVTIIDVRDVDSYKERHIPGALHIPLAYIQGEIAFLPKDKPIVTYCT
jgi:hypothetical protein